MRRILTLFLRIQTRIKSTHFTLASEKKSQILWISWRNLLFRSGLSRTVNVSS